MCQKEREFCHFLIFRSGWKWYRCEDGYQFSSGDYVGRFFVPSLPATTSAAKTQQHHSQTYVNLSSRPTPRFFTGPDKDEGSSAEFLLFLNCLTTKYVSPASLLKLLLIRAGVETNPGPTLLPTWICAHCDNKINDKIQPSARCSGCNRWLHIKCTTLKNVNERRKTPTWKGPCCNPPPPVNPQPTPHPSPQPPPAKKPRAPRHPCRPSTPPPPRR